MTISPSVFVDGELVTSAKWVSRILTAVNSIKAKAEQNRSIFQAEGTSVVNVNSEMAPTSYPHTIPLTSVQVDTDGYGLVGDGGYYAPANGLYMISGSALFAGNATGSRGVDIGNSQSVSYPGAQQRQGAIGASPLQIDVGPALVYIPKGYQTYVLAFQDTGGTLAVSYCSLSVTRVL